jgi:peptidyl-prolyl cis-trans isomerase A (cyclophilin A)
MKKSIFAVFLMIAVGTGAALAQTKKRTVTRTTKRGTTTTKTTVKKTIPAAVKQEAVTTPSGLTYIITKKGDGAPLKAGDQISVHYTGLFTNGMIFDSSYNRGQPITFPLGAGRVIKGWDEGLQKLRVGDHATFIIPASIAYGAAGKGPIPPDTTLVFLVEVVGVQ